MPINAGVYDAVVVFCDGCIRDGKSLPAADMCVPAIAEMLDDGAVLNRGVEFISDADTDVSSCYMESKAQRDSRDSFCYPALTYRLVTMVFRQRYQLHIKRTTHLHRKAESLSAYKRMYFGGMKIQEIARRPEVNFSPYLLARIIVEDLTGIPRTELAGVVKDLSLIEDDRLRTEFSECIDVDDMCSPAVDKLKAHAGIDKEEALFSALDKRGIPYLTENDLRKLGFSKTPDVRLEVPIGVKAWDGTSRIVHWIDSKATFGDPLSHAEYMEQLLGYVNRFGPGMVIYWLDYVESIHSQTPPDITVSHVMPREWVFPGSDEICVRKEDEVAALPLEAIPDITSP